MKLVGKKIVLITLILMLGLGMIGFAGECTAADSTTVKIQTPPIPGALPLLWIEENGELEGIIDLEINISPDHQRALSLISKNQIDMMVTGVNVGAKAYNKGIDLKLLNVNTWGIDYLLTNNFKAETWQDLKGKTLSLPLKGGPLDFLARYLLRENGVDPAEVNIVYRPLPNGARYFMAGKVDAILLPEPLVTVNLMKNDDAVLAMDIQEEWAKVQDGDNRIPFVGLFVSEQFATENSRQTEIINGLYMKGVDWVNNNPQQAAELGAKYFDLPAPVLLKSFQRVNLDYYSENETDRLIDIYFNEMYEMYPDLLGGKMPDEDFYFKQ